MLSHCAIYTVDASQFNICHKNASLSTGISSNGIERLTQHVNVVI